MNLLLLIEEVAGQHSSVSGAEPPWCECGGQVERGKDSCFYCGRHVRELFYERLSTDGNFWLWDRFMRERPYAEVA